MHDSCPRAGRCLSALAPRLQPLRRFVPRLVTEMLLPLFYPIVVIIMVSSDWILYQMTAKKLPPTCMLQKWGWIPESEFTIERLK